MFRHTLERLDAVLHQPDPTSARSEPVDKGLHVLLSSGCWDEDREERSKGIEIHIFFYSAENKYTHKKEKMTQNLLGTYQEPTHNHEYYVPVVLMSLSTMSPVY